MEVPTISLPPPYSNEMATVDPARPHTYQATANTNLPDTAGLIPNIRQHPNTTINLTNSSDVVIGPMTQYNGRVTIYQYMDATMNQQRAPEIGSRSRKALSRGVYCSDLQRHWLNILAVCATVLGISSTIYFVFYTNRMEASPPPIVFGRNYGSDTFPNLDGHSVIEREQWGALNHSKLRDMRRLKHPIKYVVVGHMGVQTKPCFNVYTCSVKMRSIQDNSMGNKGLLDVSANFYFGGDGNIYTGRGWNYENSYGTKTLALQFLGDFMRYELEEKQFDAFQRLLETAKAKNLLSDDYRLFGLNQTRLSKYSPGVHVVKRIKQLQRFSMCGELDFEECGKDIDVEWNFEKNLL